MPSRDKIRNKSTLLVLELKTDIEDVDSKDKKCRIKTPQKTWVQIKVIKCPKLKPISCFTVAPPLYVFPRLFFQLHQRKRTVKSPVLQVLGDIHYPDSYNALADKGKLLP